MEPVDLAAVAKLVAEGLVPTPPMQHAPMPEQSLAPVGWLTRLLRVLVPDEVDASLESPP